MSGLKLVSTGSAMPERVLTNEDLTKMVDTSDQWIRERTGIEERRVAPEGMNASDMATEAAKKALEALIETVRKTLKNEEKISLAGFGTFVVVKRAARKGINPSTKQMMDIPAKTTVKFKSSKDLLE